MFFIFYLPISSSSLCVSFFTYLYIFCPPRGWVWSPTHAPAGVLAGFPFCVSSNIYRYSGILVPPENAHFRSMVYSRMIWTRIECERYTWKILEFINNIKNYKTNKQILLLWHFIRLIKRKNIVTTLLKIVVFSVFFFICLLCVPPVCTLFSPVVE